MIATRTKQMLGRALVVVVVALTLAAAACSSESGESSPPADEAASPPPPEPEASEAQGETATAPANEPPAPAEGPAPAPAEEPPAPADEPAEVASETASGPFFLDLQTGEKTPLPETLVGDDVCGYAPSPDGTRVAYNTCGGGLYGSPTDEAMVANIDGTGAQALPAPAGLNPYVWGWSPDGTKLLYQLRKGGTKDVGNLFLYQLSSDRWTQLTELELTESPWYELHMDFSPDGQTVLFHLPRDSSMTTEWDVWSVSVSGGEPTLVLENAASPLYLPDGKEIAFIVPASSAFDGQSIAIAGADGSRRTLVTANEGIWIQRISPDRSRIAYPDGESVYVVDVSTGESSMVADGTPRAWLADDTLTVTP